MILRLRLFVIWCFSRHNFEGRRDNYDDVWTGKKTHPDGTVIAADGGIQSARGGGKGVKGSLSFAFLNPAITGQRSAKGENGRYIESIVGDAREDEMNENMGLVLAS